MTHSITASEAETFAGAVAEFTDRPNSPRPIATMMRLATGARRPCLRRWAAEWLRDKCAIEVAIEDKGSENATAATAGSLLQ